VKRERSAPGGGLDRSALAEHLAACPPCASWSAQADALDRLLAATRPEEPSAETFISIWSEVRARASEPAVLTMPAPRPWGRRGLALAVFAQAAAILLAATYALTRPVPAVAAVHDLRGEEGAVLIVTIDGGPGTVPGVEIRPQRGGSDADMVSADLDVLNYMESL
jgi:anti-sigma factor RsiW